MGKQAVGYKAKTTIDFESAFGTLPVPQKGKVMPFNSSDVAQSQNIIETATLTGTRNPSEPAMGRVSVDGNHEVPVDFDAFGIYLKALLGDPVTTDNGDGTFTHVFKVGDNQPSFTLARDFPDLGKCFVYRGCKVGSLQIPFGGDHELVATMSILGKNRVLGTGAYQDDAEELKLYRASNFMAYVKENGTKNCDVRSGEFTIDAGLDGDQYTLCDGNSRGDIPEGMINISGNAEFIFNSMEMLSIADNGSVRSLDIGFEHGSRSLLFHFPEILWDVTDPTVTGPAGIFYTMNWRAFLRNFTEESAVVVTLTNEVEAY